MWLIAQIQGVFESVDVPNGGFQPFAVAETMEIVTSVSGLHIKPDYTFANVPEVKVVVIPAQKGSDAMRDWLKKVSQSADVTMSVCTGAFHLAKAGLLNGKAATTHHEYIDKFEKTTVSVKKYQQYRDLFPGCIAAGMSLLVVQLLLSQTIWKKLP